MEQATVKERILPYEVRDKRTRTGKRTDHVKDYVVVLPDGTEYKDFDGLGFANRYAAECYAAGYNAGMAAR
jgi:hypothetical protein